MDVFVNERVCELLAIGTDHGEVRDIFLAGHFIQTLRIDLKRAAKVRLTLDGLAPKRAVGIEGRALALLIGAIDDETSISRS